MIWAALKQSLYSVILFSLLAIPGWAFTKKSWITSSQVDGISQVLVNYLWPIMVIDAMLQAKLTADTLQSVSILTAVTVIGILLIAGISLALFHLLKRAIQPNGIYVFALMFANTGLVGLPLIRSMLGEESLFFASIVELINDILIFSVGMLILQKACGSKEKLSIKSLFSPGFIGVLIGLLLFLLQVSLPSILEEAFHMISQATSPITMFVIGCQLGEQSLRPLLKEKRLYLLSFGKLFLVPALIYLPLRIVFPSFSLLQKVLVLLFAMPSGTCCALFVRQFKGDYALATNCVTLTTLLSILTLPIWMVLCAI